MTQMSDSEKVTEMRALKEKQERFELLLKGLTEKVAAIARAHETNEYAIMSLQTFVRRATSILEEEQ